MFTYFITAVWGPVDSECIVAFLCHLSVKNAFLCILMVQLFCVAMAIILMIACLQQSAEFDADVVATAEGDV